MTPRALSIRPWATAVIVFLLLGLSACGFQLRGQFNFPFDSLSRTGLNNTDMARTLDMQLQIYKLKVNAVTNPPVFLELMGERGHLTIAQQLVIVQRMRTAYGFLAPRRRAGVRPKCDLAGITAPGTYTLVLTVSKTASITNTTGGATNTAGSVASSAPFSYRLVTAPVTGPILTVSP